MKDQTKTKKQLIRELTDLRQRISECERIESERGQAEEALRRVQAYTESILGSMTNIYILFDRQWRYLYVNEAAARAIGRQREQILGRTLWELYPDIVGTELDRQYHRAMEERVPVAFDFHYPTTDTWWENRFYPAPEGLTAFATDITARKRGEKALLESEECFHSFFENVAVAVSLVDPDGYVVDANDTDCRFLGYSRSELIGMHFARFTPPEDIDLDVELFQSLVGGQRQGYEIEKRYVRKGGEVVWGQLAVSLIRNSQGLPKYTSVVCIDITDRKQMEEELRKSRGFLDSILYTAPMLIYVTSVDNRYLLVNKAWEEFVGKNREEIIGLSMEQVFSSKTSLTFKDQNQQVVDQGLPLVIEEQMPALGGTHHFYTIKFPLFDNRGKVEAVGGISLDITEKKQGEEKIKEMSRFLEAVIDNANIWVDVLDENANVVIWNKAAETISGYSAQEVIGNDKIWEWLYPGENNHETLKDRVIQLLQATNGKREFETTIRTKAGEEKTVSWFSRDLVNDKGTTTGSVLLGQDITERKRTAQVLIETNQHLQALINASPLAIVSQDYRGNVLEWNPAAERIFGWREKEVLEKPTPIIPEDKKEEFRNIFGKVLKGETVSGLETYRQTKDGVLVDVRLSSATLYGSDGKPKGNVTLLEDITERRKTEEERLRLIEQLRTGRERLQELSRRLIDLQETERREIARELHDEVGQNLTALSINLNIIQNLMPGETASMATDRINDSQKLVDETVICIRNVMARLRPPVLDDYGLVAALNWYSGQFMKRNGIPAVLTLKGEELAHRLPLGTETAMFRIAQEALNNVAKHAKASQVTLVLENRDENVLLVIDDNGRGFDLEAHHQNGAQPEWGLINMRERAHSIGGQFRIESTPGKGTKIIVEVPRKR